MGRSACAWGRPEPASVQGMGRGGLGWGGVGVLPGAQQQPVRRARSACGRPQHAWRNPGLHAQPGPVGMKARRGARGAAAYMSWLCPHLPPPSSSSACARRKPPKSLRRSRPCSFCRPSSCSCSWAWACGPCWLRRSGRSTRGATLPSRSGAHAMCPSRMRTAGGIRGGGGLSVALPAYRLGAWSRSRACSRQQHSWAWLCARLSNAHCMPHA